MPRSSNSFLFPDVNVWVALTYQRHTHHDAAARWLATLGDEDRLHFCRVTQLSMLRLLTTAAVMGAADVLTQVEAWKAYDQWMADDRVSFLTEPSNLDATFRSLTKQSHPAAKDWADAYLAAFASNADLELVSFDQGFRGRVKSLKLLSV